MITTTIFTARWRYNKMLTALFCPLLTLMLLAVAGSPAQAAERTYNIGFHTADENESGTNDSVYVTFICENGESERFECNNSGNDFYYDDRDDYEFTGEDLGQVQQIRIYLDGSDALCLSKMYFQDKTYDMKGYWINDESAAFDVYYGEETKLGYLDHKPYLPRTYTIGFHTDNVSGAYSDKNTQIIFVGEDAETTVGISDERGLNSDKYYTFDDYDVGGQVKQIKIKYSASSDAWCVGRIYFQDKIYHTDGYWLRDETITLDVYYGEETELLYQDGRVMLPHVYEIGFHTDDEYEAGTDSEVFVTFICANGTTPRWECDNSGNDMVRDSDDHYSFWGEDLGEVRQIVLEVNGSDAWCMGRIYFQDKTYHTFGCWINDETATFDVYYGNATEINVNDGVMYPQNAGSVFSQMSQGTWFAIIGGGVVFAVGLIFAVVRRKRENAQ